MKKTIFYLLLFLLGSGYSNAQNCPAYSNTATGLGSACGNQDYIFSVANTGCNGMISFTVTGNYGSYGNEISWQVVSNLTGQVVASGYGFNYGAINITVGPLDPNVQGNVFDLIVNDSWGDGFSGGGSIQVQQNGITLANISGNFGSQAHMMFNANISISPATITITTPSGNVTATVNNCNDFIVQVPLANANFCNPINVNLPWTIVCDVTGATLSSGTHAVTVYPRVPSSASDVVDISWNTTTCSWDVSPQNDCGLLDIGTVFAISPDPAQLNTDACGNGSENFTVNYVGVSGSPDCCATGGPMVNITYDDTLTANNAVATTSPFGGNNNSAYINLPPNNSGGNATSLNLCISVSNYCFIPPMYSSDQSFFVFIFIDGNQVYMSPQQFGTTFNNCINLGNVPGGYNQSSNIQIYVLPNILSSSGMYTNYAPNGSCGSLSMGQWTSNINVTLNVVFDQMIGSAQNCSFPLTAQHTCCLNLTPPTAPNPAPINVDCTNNVPAPDPSVVINTTSACATPPTVTFVSDVSDNNTCQGEIITRTYRVEDACSNATNVTQTINITATNPTFTLSGTNPTTCNGTDGEIIISGLNPSTSYALGYMFGGSIVGPISFTTDGSGNYTVTGLTDGAYTLFTIGLASCPACIGNDPVGITLTPLSAPTVNAGNDQSICIGSSVTLTAVNPSGANISWDNGVTDGVAFTPALGTITYTVTATKSGCIATDAVVITVNDLPVVSITPVADQCQNNSPVNLVGNPSGGTFSGNGVSASTFNPTNAGIGAHTISYSFTDGNNCSNTATTLINVVANPSFTVTSSNPTGCLVNDGSITIAGLQPNTLYIVTYSVVNGNTIGPANFTSDANGNIVLNNIGVGSYSNFVVELNGCAGTVNTVVTLVPNDAPDIDAGVDVTVCEGETVILTATNPDNANITWNNGITDGVGFIPPTGITTYTVTAVVDGCATKDSVLVTVISNPIVNAGNDVTACEGEQVTLSATGANTYVWSDGVINNIPFLPPSGTTIYSVEGTNAAGCKGNDQVSVTVISSGAAYFTMSEDHGCTPLTVSFTNTSQINGTCTYLFSNGVELSGCNPSYTFVDASCFDITLTIKDINYGCLSTITQTICVDAPPIADFTIQPSYLSVVNQEISFFNSSHNATSYIWDFGDTEFSNEENPNHFYNLDVDQYIVSLVATSALGCSDTATTIIPVREELIYFIPNSFTPDEDNLNQVFKPIFTSGFDPQDYHLSIFNRWGEIVFESFDAEYGWDGSYGEGNHMIAKEGVYVWKIEFKTTQSDERKKISGHVNLLK